MKCAECQHVCLECAGRDLPEAVSAHLLECPACRKANARAVTLVQMLSIKKYEQPDEYFDARMLARVESGIREWQEQPHGFAARVLEFLAGGRIPALRYAMAAMVVALIGLNMVSVQNMPALPSSSIAAERVEAKRVAMAPAGSTNQYFNPSLPIVFMNSNAQPAGIRYGNVPSRLVGFEY